MWPGLPGDESKDEREDVKGAGITETHIIMIGCLNNRAAKKVALQ